MVNIARVPFFYQPSSNYAFCSHESNAQTWQASIKIAFAASQSVMSNITVPNGRSGEKGSKEELYFSCHLAGK